LFVCLIAALVGWMPRVDRPAIETDVGRPSSDLFELLVFIVAGFAQGLQRTEEELVGVTVVGFHVVNNISGLGCAVLQTERTEGVLCEL
jgi:hypothetical protein